MADNDASKDDAFFLDMVRPHWLARLQAPCGDRDHAELVTDAVETSLRSISEVYGLSVQDMWASLVGGYTDAMTLAYMVAAGLPKPDA